MKQKRDFLEYLNDMNDALDKGMSFIKRMTFEEFSKDERTQFAVIRVIEVIGEASKKIPNEIKNQSGEIPWKNMGGM